MTHIFTFTEDEESGIEGWRLDKKPYFDVMQGAGVAHDVIEEAPHGGEQPHDELLALGCFLWARGNNNWTGYRSAKEGLVYDLCEILRHIADEEGYFMKPAPKTRPLSEYDYDDLEEQIQYIAREYCEKLSDWVGSDFGPEDEEEQAEMIAEYRSYQSHVISWLRLGVRRARRRYCQLDAWSVSMLFEQITKEVDKLTKQATELDKLYVTVNIKRCCFVARLQPYRDPYANYRW